MEWIVELTDVTKRHGSTVAVDRLSLKIRRGEFFSILGPSGSGKTTTLRLLAGFDDPDHGDIAIGGRSMRQVPPQRRPVNTVFQQYALFPHMTVAQNVAFGLEMRGEPRATIRRRVQEALAMVKLEGKDSRYPAGLSGGEQQRVALARALVNQPSVLLLDEPLSALDQQLRREMQVELKAIQAQTGTTFVCVTHHQEDALMLSDRLAVMREGRALQIGTPKAVYEQPADAWIADFIGVSNSLRGCLAAVNGRSCTVQVPSLTEAEPITVRPPGRWPTGATVILVVRPERLRLSRERAVGSGLNQVRARVVDVRYGGGELRHRLRLSEQIEWTVNIMNRGADQTPFLMGEELFIAWGEQDAVLVAG